MFYPFFAAASPKRTSVGRVRREKYFALASAQRNWPRQTRRLMSGQSVFVGTCAHGRAGRSESSFVKKGRRPFLISSNPRNHCGYGDFLWRSGRDLNPRAAFDDNTISSRARYDHFDTTAYSCCDNSIDYYSKFSGIVKWKIHKFRKNPCATDFSVTAEAKRKRGLRRASAHIPFRSPEKDAQTLSMASRKSL